MIDLPDSSTFAALLAERRFWLAAGVAALAGAARGFSGFGSSLIYIPLISMLYGPKAAAASVILIDVFTGVPYGIRAFPQSEWRDVVPLTGMALLTLPLGTYLLLAVDPVWLRWFICFFVLFAVPILASGWRYHGKPKLPITLGVGVVAGIASGVAQIAGPPVALYWLGGALKAAIARANMFVFFAVLGVASCVTYFVEGLYTKDILALVVLLGIPFTALFLFGVLSFHRASEEIYRRICYGVIAFAGIVSLPLFDRFFH
jgi:uncharacterized membrane protein YfcA